MRIALAEMRRRRGRWLSIVGALAFILFLVLYIWRRMRYKAVPKE